MLVCKNHLTFVDDSYYSQKFKREFYTVRDAKGNNDHVLNRIEYLFLTHFVKPQVEYNAKNHFNRLKTKHSQEEICTDFNKYIRKFRSLGLIRKVKDGYKFRHKSRPIVVKGGMFKDKSGRVTHVRPTNIAFSLTNRCNLNCKHCSQDSKTLKQHIYGEELATAEIKTIFDQIDDIGVRVVRITGGEPLIRNDFTDILLSAADHRFDLHLLTNGFALSEENIELITEIHKKKGILIKMSLDGSNAKNHDWFRGRKGAFRNVVRSAQEFSRRSIPFALETILNKHNSRDIEAVIKKALDMGACRISIHTASAFGRAYSNFGHLYFDIDEMYKLKKYINNLQKIYGEHIGIHFDSYAWPVVSRRLIKNGIHREIPNNYFNISDVQEDPRKCQRCTAASSQLTISADGDIYPCPNCIDKPLFKAGNIRKTSLSEIWRKGHWGIFRKKWLVNDLIFCSKCKLIEFCQYGYKCRPSAYVATGDLVGPPRDCIMSFRDLGMGKEYTLSYLRTCLENSAQYFHKNIKQLIEYVKER